ncbi:22811_t:CDS:1, partial [Gigaspora margarita]
MHIAEKSLYLIYKEKTRIVPISTNSSSIVEPVIKHSESKNTFDKFEYKDEVLDEAE